MSSPPISAVAVTEKAKAQRRCAPGGEVLVGVRVRAEVRVRVRARVGLRLGLGL